MSFTETLSALVEDGAVLAGLLLAFAVAWLTTPLAGRLARATGRVDAGDDRPRIHTVPTPNTGGVAIVAAIAVAALGFAELDGSMAGIFLALPLVMLIGLWDDRRGMAPKVKLALLVAVTLIPVAAYGLTFERVTLPVLGDGDLGWVAYPLTVVWIVLVANLVNLIDGLDGLAGGIVAIAAATLALLAVSFGRLEVAAVAAAVCGATLGFLGHNLHPAKIFMGDSGALSLGYLLAALSVEGLLKTPATITLLAPMLIVAVPLLDTSFVILKRLKYHRPPSAPTRTTSTTAFCASASRSGGPPPTCTVGGLAGRLGHAGALHASASQWRLGAGQQPGRRRRRPRGHARLDLDGLHPRDPQVPPPGPDAPAPDPSGCHVNGDRRSRRARPPDRRVRVRLGLSPPPGAASTIVPCPSVRTMPGFTRTPAATPPRRPLAPRRSTGVLHRIAPRMRSR